MKVNLPSDFAKAVADALGWKLAQVDDAFDFEEDKQGFFWAKLKPKKFLEKLDFRTVCALTRDLGGEGYLMGAKAWKVPGPYAKKAPASDEAPEDPKPVTTSTLAPAPLPSTSQPQDVRGISDQLKFDKSKPPELPNLKFVPVDAIKIPPFLPTRTLIAYEKQSKIRESIKKHGLKYPIKVRPGPEPGTYELKDGYLRLTSVQQLGWKEILAEIKDTPDQEVVIESLVANKDRIEEDPITVAQKLDILINAFGFTQEKLAEELGIDRSTIANMIRLLKLPKEIQHCLALNNVTFYHGLLLLTLDDPNLQVQLTKEIVENDLSTRQLEKRIDELQPKPIPEAPSQPEPQGGFEPTTQARRAESPDLRQTTEAPLEQGIDSEAAHKEVGNAPQEPKAPEPEAGPPQPEPQDFAEVTCPECGEHFRLAHYGPHDHRIEYYREGEEK
ncbi:MAG TPA: ParB/RepB/Spo0J family partition protein [Candidatus Bathyarchaeia archaeon]|nr:ParB/RepB/Spo0J family partition protein [Candidatus Bathyarchaeia archaeon]